MENNHQVFKLEQLNKILTKDNYKNFLKDFEAWVEMGITLVDSGTVQNNWFDVFDWTDDGVVGCNGITVEFR